MKRPFAGPRPLGAPATLPGPIVQQADTFVLSNILNDTRFID